MIATDGGHLPTNLEALRSHQPALAEELEKTGIPLGVTPTVGRDGSASLRIESDDGTSRWLGRASMPRVRAAALVDLLGFNGENVFISPMGNGAEVEEVLRRGAAHAAVFIYDPDPVDIVLALSLTDFSAHIRSGRLVILTGADPARSAVDVFADHPGYEFPRKMLVPPYVEAEAIESLRVAVERACGEVEQARTKIVAACANEVAASALDVDRRPVRVTVTSLDPRPFVAVAARSIGSAAAAVGMRVVVSLPDRPDECHSMARVRALAEHRAGAAILLNGGWGTLLPHVPAVLRAATWLLPGAAIVGGLTDGFNDRHVVFATTGELARAAVAAGVGSDRVRILELGIDGASFHATPVVERDRFDVACVGDVANLEAEACGIDLTTRKILWQHVRAQAAETPGDAPSSILDRAERASGVALNNANTRTQFHTMIRVRLIPTLLGVTIVEALLSGDIDVRVCGAGWCHTDTPADRVGPVPDTPAGFNVLYNTARIVVFPLFDDRVARMALEVALAGGCALCRRPGDDLAQCHPQLRDALEAIPMFNSARELIKLVRHFTRDDKARADACARARSIVEDRHLMRHRVTTILDALAELGVRS